MRLLLVNPNASDATTDRMVGGARDLLGAGVEVTGVTAHDSVASIDGHYEDAVAAAAVCRVMLAEVGRHDAALLSCFDDPGLYAARELWEAPVVGIGEASIHLAMTLGHRYGILTTLARGVPGLHDLTERYGVASRCAAIVAAGIAVDEVSAAPEATRDALLAAGRDAIEAGAEALCLGCGSLVGRQDELAALLGVPVLDPVRAGAVLAWALAHGGWRTAKVGAYRWPESLPPAAV